MWVSACLLGLALGSRIWLQTHFHTYTHFHFHTGAAHIPGMCLCVGWWRGVGYKVLGLNFPLINRPTGLSEPRQPATELICPQGGCMGEVIPPWSWTITCTLHSHTHAHTQTQKTYTQTYTDALHAHTEFDSFDWDSPDHITILSSFIEAKQFYLFWTLWSHTQ